MNSRFLSKLIAMMLWIIISCLSLSIPRQVHADVEVNISVFHEALAPYGHWINHHSYGEVWYPSDVPNGWRPYTDGHWAHTNDYGWLWVADQNWGWAPFHYGRWAWDDGYGWLWVPGYTWSPAWVFWRSGGGYAAWAPMPPNVLWQSNQLELRYFNDRRDLRQDAWVAVRDYDLPYMSVRERCFLPHDNPRIIQVTNYINNITVINHTIVNQGIPVRELEHSTRRPIKTVIPNIQRDYRPRHDGQLSVVDDNRPTIIRPDMVAPTTNRDNHRPEALTTTLTEDKALRIAPPIAQPVTEQLQHPDISAPRLPRPLIQETAPERINQPAPILNQPTRIKSPTLPQRPAPLAPRQLYPFPIEQGQERQQQQAEQQRQQMQEKQQERAEQQRQRMQESQQQQVEQQRQQIQERQQQQVEQQRQQMQERQQQQVEQQRQQMQERQQQQVEQQRQQMQERPQRSRRDAQ